MSRSTSALAMPHRAEVSPGVSEIHTFLEGNLAKHRGPTTHLDRAVGYILAFPGQSTEHHRFAGL